MKKKKIKSMATGIALSLTLPTMIFASEASFEGDPYLKYQGTGYVTEKSGTNELVTKMDTYYGMNLQDMKICAVDAYFYKRNSVGTVINSNHYGYATAQFEKGSSVTASSGRIYGYRNVEAYSDVCVDWTYEPHYYGKTFGTFYK